jgi:hypothetical protein
MMTVDNPLLRDCIAYGIAARHGARKHRSPVPQLSGGPDRGPRDAEILEFAIDGEVVLRKVKACGLIECWLRADLALETLVARVEAAAEIERVKAVMTDFIHTTDAAGAQRHGISVDAYRAKRHADGARWDKYRAQQRAGGY